MSRIKSSFVRISRDNVHSRWSRTNNESIRKNIVSSRSSFFQPESTSLKRRSTTVAFDESKLNFERKKTNIKSGSSFGAQCESNKKQTIQELALHIQSLRDPKVYSQYLDTHKTKVNDELIGDTIKVINSYAESKSHIPLSHVSQDSIPILLSGPEFCHSLMTSVILPHFANQEKITGRQMDGVLYCTFKTIQSLGRLCLQRNKEHQNDKGNYQDSGNMRIGYLAENILRQLLNTPFPKVYTESRTDSGNQLRKVDYLYNNTLNTWSNIAASEKNPLAAKAAAQQAERLLLDLILSGRDSTPIGNGDSNKGTFLMSLKPDIVSFNTTIKSWSKSGRFQMDDGKKVDVTSVLAAERSEAMLRLLIDVYEQSKVLGEDSDCISPNRMSYEHVIQAWSRAIDSEAPQRASKILDEMIERYNRIYLESNDPIVDHENRPPFPSRQTFSSVLTTLARSSLLSSRETNDVISDAEALFKRMRRLGDKGFDINKPDTIAYNSLLQVYANNILVLLENDPNVEKLESAITLANRIDEIVHEMVAIHNDENIRINKDDTTPDFTTHHIAMSSYLRLCIEIAKLETKGEVLSLSSVDSAMKVKEHLQKLMHFRPKWNDLFTPFHRHRRVSHKPSQVEFEQVFDILLQNCNDERIINEFENLFFGKSNSATQIDPTTRMINSLILAYSRRASTHIEFARKADSIMTKVLKSYEKSLQNISEGRIIARPNTFTLHTVLAAYADACGKKELRYKSRYKAVERMEEILNQMEQMHMERIECRDPRIRKQMARVSPNVNSYNILLNTYSARSKHAKDINQIRALTSKAEGLIERMRTLSRRQNKRVRPDNYTYASLLNLLSETKDPNSSRKALDILGKAQKEIVDGCDVILFNTALKVIKNPLALEIFQKMKKGEFGERAKPDKFTYSKIMSSLGAEGTVEAAQEVENLYKDLLSHSTIDAKIKRGKDKRDNTPDIYCYNSIIAAWANVHTIDSCKRAENHLDTLLEKNSIDPDNASFSSVLKGYYGKVGKDAASDCERILDKREQYCKNNPLQLVITDYLLVIKKYQAEQRPKDCYRVLLRLLDQIKLQDGDFSGQRNQLTHCFNTVMFAFKKSRCQDSNDNIIELFNLLSSTPFIEPDGFTYYLLLAAHVENFTENTLHTVNEQFKLILNSEKKKGTQSARPSTSMFNIVLKACEKSQLSQNGTEDPLKIAFEHYESFEGSMKKWCLKPNEHTFNLMLAICKKHVEDEVKREELVQRLFIDCCRSGNLNKEFLSQCESMLSDQSFRSLVSSLTGTDIKRIGEISLHSFPSEFKKKVL